MTISPDTDSGSDAENVVDPVEERGTGGAGGEHGARDFPRLRLRNSLPARVLAIMLLVVLATWGSAVVNVRQIHNLDIGFNLLTGVYVPFQERLTNANLQAVRIGMEVRREDYPNFRPGEELIYREALRQRTELVRVARRPIDEALAHPERVQSDHHIERFRELVTLLDELETRVQADEDADFLADPESDTSDEDNEEMTLTALSPVDRASAAVRRQSRIERLFRKLRSRGRAAVTDQRQEVEVGRAQAERMVWWASLWAAILAVLAGVGIVWTMRPLRRLSEKVRSLGSGDWAQRIKVPTQLHSDDEVGRLAREFNSMAEDLEERERLLIRGERLAAVGQLASQITHEIRNPLSSVALNSELLLDELEEAGVDGDVRQLLGKIMDEVDRLTVITEDYLQLSRPKKPLFIEVDLALELEDLLGFLGESFKQSGVRVEVRGLEGVFLVNGDANQLRQVFLNLLRNAQDAVSSVSSETNARDPLLELSIRRDRAEVVVAVIDNGTGIPLPSEQLEKVFEPFFSDKTYGTGLGLPIVQQIVQDHGGCVTIVSSDGEGTTFEVRLPACDPRASSVSSGP